MGICGPSVGICGPSVGRLLCISSVSVGHLCCVCYASAVYLWILYDLYYFSFCEGSTLLEKIRALRTILQLMKGDRREMDRAIIEAKCVRGLLCILRTDEYGLITIACDALLGLSNYPDVRRDIVHLGGIGLLARLVKCRDGVVRRFVMDIISNLASGNIIVKEAIMAADFLYPIVAAVLLFFVFLYSPQIHCRCIADSPLTDSFCIFS